MKRIDAYRVKLEKTLRSNEAETPITITALPLIIHNYAWDVKVRVKRFGHLCVQSHPKVGLRSRLKFPAGTKMLARKLRSSFEQVDHVDKFEHFLSFCGPFREKASAQNIEQNIEWEEFQEWQLFMRELQTASVPSVHKYGPVGRMLESYVLDMGAIRIASVHREGGPHFEATPETALQVIAVTIAADLLNRVELRKCSGCTRLYPKESLHHERDENFCTDECRNRKWQRDNKRSAKGGGNGKA